MPQHFNRSGAIIPDLPIVNLAGGNDEVLIPLGPPPRNLQVTPLAGGGDEALIPRDGPRRNPFPRNPAFSNNPGPAGNRRRVFAPNFPQHLLDSMIASGLFGNLQGANANQGGVFGPGTHTFNLAPQAPAPQAPAVPPTSVPTNPFYAPLRPNDTPLNLNGSGLGPNRTPLNFNPSLFNF